MIRELHEELRRRLQSAASIFDGGVSKASLEKEHIFDIFIKMKKRFLVYVPFLDSLRGAQRLLGLMKHDPSMQREMEQIEADVLQETESSDNIKYPKSLMDLMALPFQQLIR